MKTSSNKRSVIVGIFVLLGLAILVLTIFTLGSQLNISNAITSIFFRKCKCLQKVKISGFPG